MKTIKNIFKIYAKAKKSRERERESKNDPLQILKLKFPLCLKGARGISTPLVKGGWGVLKITLTSLIAALACAGIIYAASTIGTNISTDGTLSATGQTTLGNASSTLFSVSGNTWLGTTIISSGNLGIGTTSPYAKLSVVGETVASYFTATSTTATSTFAGIFSIGSTTPAAASMFSVGTSSPLLFISKNSGNVGIGTSNPSSALTITGDLTVSGDSAGTGGGASYYICASNALNKVGCDYIADGTSDEVQIQAALDTYTYAQTGGVHVVLSDGTFTICDPLLMEGNEWLSGQGLVATRITLCNTWTVSETLTGATSIHLSGTDVHVTVPTIASYAIGDYIWISTFAEDHASNFDLYLTNQEYCVADIADTNDLVLGAPQGDWASCASNKINASTFCGGAACTVGTITTQARVGIMYDASKSAGKRNRAAIWYKEGSTANQNLMVSNLGLLGGVEYASRGIDTGDGYYTNKMTRPIFKNLAVDSFSGDGMRIDMDMDALFDIVLVGKIGGNQGYGINIPAGGDFTMKGVNSWENRKAGLALGTVGSAARGLITQSFFGAARTDAVEGHGVKILGSGSTVFSNSAFYSPGSGYGILNNSSAVSFLNNSITNGLYIDSSAGQVIVVGNDFIAGTNDGVIIEGVNVEGGNYIENNTGIEDTCTTSCTVNSYQATALSGASGIINGTLKAGQYKGQKKKVYMSDATNPVRLLFDGTYGPHWLGNTRIFCFFDTVGEYWEGTWSGSNWVDVAYTCDLGYRNNDTGQTLDPDVPFTYLDSTGGAVSGGILGNPTDSQRWHGKLHTIGMTVATNCGAGCAVTITNCDQDDVDGDNNCDVSLNATTDKCTFMWDAVGTGGTAEWKLISNSSCTITD